MNKLRIDFYIDNNRVLPRVLSIKGITGKISLSRSGLACFFTPKEFPSHDGHAPSFETTHEAQDYINRLTKDILQAWKEAE